MRYTTVIDISEYRATYKNLNARLLYLHLALKSGYHDDDRDLIATSIRRMSSDAGLTVSAVRHALATLERDGLVTKTEDGRLKILKWIVAEVPTPRRQPKAAKTDDNAIGEKLDKQVEEYRQKVLNAVRQSSKDELQAWLQELKDGRRITHHGASIAPNQDNINWLQNVIKRL